MKVPLIDHALGVNEFGNKREETLLRTCGCALPCSQDQAIDFDPGHNYCTLHNYTLLYFPPIYA
jgi:hypothetical protein